MASILLHSCCGPCSIYVVKNLKEQGLDVTAFWYNPNIHPFREHRQRLEAMETFAKVENIPLIVTEGYDMLEYFRLVVGHEREGERCAPCFHIRLSRTAKVAREKGFDFFTTTLLISPYQTHGLLREAGEKAGNEGGVEFYYQDFRNGFRESHRLSRELGLYHQGYCGCIYSEWERYGKTKI
ncbi:epoxyqueuosine reductase QueH [Chloroflexota bacterium]